MVRVDGEKVVEKFSLALNELWGGVGLVLAASQVCVVYGFGWWVEVKALS